jgi:hypothetical protein
MSWVLQEESFYFLPAARRIEPYFAMADVFISNTLGGGVTWGLATLEAMGARRKTLLQQPPKRVEGTLELLHPSSYHHLDQHYRLD